MKTMLIMLVFAAVSLGRPFCVLAEGTCLTQPDYSQDFLAATSFDPNHPAVTDKGFPVLGPKPGDPNTWSLQCGPQRIGGFWCDREGQECTLTVVESDIPCEASTTQPRTDAEGVYHQGEWSLTMTVTPEWHVIHVRLTDTPPSWSKDPASQDVLIVFRGEYGPNVPPVLY